MNFQNNRYTLEFAEDKNNDGIIKVFESGYFSGGISVKYLRNPNPLASFSADGDEAKNMIIRDNEFNKIIPKEDLNSHIYVMASTKSGKSELIKLMYIKYALNPDGSIVIFDPHGDLSQQCAKMMDNKKDIIYIYPTLKKGLTPTINPFRLKSQLSHIKPSCFLV